MNEYIMYACPTGVLAAQIERYVAASMAACGPNAAHRYPPHCTLTGFFHDQAARVPSYVAAITAALTHRQTSRPNPALTITGLQTSAEWIGLTLDGPWLTATIAEVASAVAAPSGPTLRLKDWLHLSLAYEFPAEHASTLARLAHELITPAAEVGWELRFYQREAGNVWHVVAQWEV